MSGGMFGQFSSQFNNATTSSNSGRLCPLGHVTLLGSQPQIVGGFASQQVATNHPTSLLEQQLQMQQHSQASKMTLLSTPGQSNPKPAVKTLLGPRPSLMSTPVVKNSSTISNLELEQQKQTNVSFGNPLMQMSHSFSQPPLQQSPFFQPQSQYFPPGPPPFFNRPPQFNPVMQPYSQMIPASIPFSNPTPQPFFQPATQPIEPKLPIPSNATHETNLPFVQKILHLNQAIPLPPLPKPTDKPLFPAKQEPLIKTKESISKSSEKIMDNMVSVHSVFSSVQPPIKSADVVAAPVRYISSPNVTTQSTSTVVSSCSSAQSSTTNSTTTSTSTVIFPAAMTQLKKDQSVENKPAIAKVTALPSVTLPVKTNSVTKDKPVVASAKLETPVEMADRKFKAVIEEEEEFEASCKDWMKQYYAWLKENENHPNKKQFYEYKKEWTNYIEKMQKKRNEIVVRKKSTKEELTKLLVAEKKIKEQEDKKFEPTDEQVLELKKKAEEMSNLYKQKANVQKLQQSIKINMPLKLKTNKANDDAPRKYRERKKSGSSSSSRSRSKSRRKSRSRSRSRKRSSRSPRTRYRRRTRSRSRSPNGRYSRSSYDRSSSYDRWNDNYRDFSQSKYEPVPTADLSTGASEVIDYGHGRTLGTRFVPGAPAAAPVDDRPKVETWKPDTPPPPPPIQNSAYDDYFEYYEEDRGQYFPQPRLHGHPFGVRPPPRGYPPRFRHDGMPLRRPPPPQMGMRPRPPPHGWRGPLPPQPRGYSGDPLHPQPRGYAGDPSLHLHLRGYAGDPSSHPHPRGYAGDPSHPHPRGYAGDPSHPHPRGFAGDPLHPYQQRPQRFPMPPRQPIPNDYYKDEESSDFIHHHPPPQARPPAPFHPNEQTQMNYDQPAPSRFPPPPRGPQPPFQRPPFSRPLFPSDSPVRQLAATPPLPPPVKFEVISIDSLLKLPCRNKRPGNILIIMRGLPGSGKTMLCKAIKEKEVEVGGSAPRILCLDDYFTVDGIYDYEPDQKVEYEANLLKAFRRQVDLGYFSFIILDCVNSKNSEFEPFMVYAKMKGYTVYFLELDVDPWTCYHRNIHNRSLENIQEIKMDWEPIHTPFLKIDPSTLLQEIGIDEVEMEDESHTTPPVKAEPSETEEEEDLSSGLVASKWDLEAIEDKMVRLDGLMKRPHKEESPQGIAEYLQMDTDSRQDIPGLKRVRWADLEEMKAQSRRKQLGFVVGQTDWSKLTTNDNQLADQALNRTKYF